MTIEIVEINGGIVFSGAGRVIATLTLGVDQDGRVVTIHNVANPQAAGRRGPDRPPRRPHPLTRRSAGPAGPARRPEGHLKRTVSGPWQCSGCHRRDGTRTLRSRRCAGSSTRRDITLDGVIEAPAWTSPYFDEEAMAFAGAQTDAADALLMGRRTYEGFAAAWPKMDESDPTTGAAYFNNVKKYVASTTLTNPGWRNSQVFQGDLIEEVTRLKAAEGRGILMYGYAVVTHALLRAGLVDQVRFWIHPVLQGGPSVTSPLADLPTTLALADTRVMKSGVIIATYTRSPPDRRPAGRLATTSGDRSDRTRPPAGVPRAGRG